MSSYHVEFETSAAKALAKLPRADAKRIKDKTDELKSNPRPHGVEKLTGAEAWRVRVGNYRIVYTIEDAVRIVTITRIAHRKEVYRRL